MVRLSARGRGLLLVILATSALGACTQTRQFASRWELVRKPTPCADTSLVIYFEEGSAALTGPARQLLRETGRRYHACNVTQVRVVGLADATGTPEANLNLSQKRAAQVAAALTRNGLPSPSFERAIGDEGATLRDGREQPMRRRAEVFLIIKPR